MANAIIVPPLPFTAMPGAPSAAGFNLSAIGTDYRGIIWRSATGTSVYWVVDLGADTVIDTVMLFGLWGNFASATAKLSIVTATAAQGPTFGGGSTISGLGAGNYYRFPATPVLLDGTPIAPGNGVFLWRRPAGDPSPRAIRYLYLQAIDMGPAGWIDVSRLVVGRAFAPERNFSFSAAFGVRDLGAVDFSRRGVLLRTRGKKLRTTGLTFSSLHRDEVEAVTGPLLEEIGNTEAIALVTDPDPHAERQRRCYFGPLVGDLGHVWRSPAGFELRANMVSLF